MSTVIASGAKQSFNPPQPLPGGDPEPVKWYLCTLIPMHIAYHRIPHPHAAYRIPLNIFKTHLLQPLLFQQPCNPFNNCSPDLKIDRKVRILMSDINSCSDDKMYLITLHYQLHDFVCRTFPEFDTVVI